MSKPFGFKIFKIMTKLITSDYDSDSLTNKFIRSIKIEEYDEAINRLCAMRLGSIKTIKISQTKKFRCFYRIQSNKLYDDIWSTHSLRLMGICIDKTIQCIVRYEKNCN